MRAYSLRSLALNCFDNGLDAGAYDFAGIGCTESG
jgi:hypothetical protein